MLLPLLLKLFRPLLKPAPWSLALVVLAFSLAFFWHEAALAQGQARPLPAPPPGIPTAPAAPTPPAEIPAPQAIPIPDIAPQAELALAEIRQLENRRQIEDVIDITSDRIPLLERETSYRLQEARRLALSAFSLETIQKMEEELRDVEFQTIAIRRDLTRAALQSDRDLKQLEELDTTWDATIKAAPDEAAPRGVLDRAKDLVREIASAKKNVLNDRAKVLALQGRATDMGMRLSEIRQLLAAANERAVTRLLYRDGPPLWSASFWDTSIHSFSGEAGDHLMGQASTIADYFRFHRKDFVFHAIFFIGLVIILSVARTKVDILSRSDEELTANKKIFDMPVVTAMLVAMLFSAWFYPRPPRALWLMIGVLAAGPLLVVARRIIELRIYLLLYLTVVFYLVDRARALFAPLPGVYRFLLLLEVLSLILFIVNTLRRHQHAVETAPQEERFIWRVIRGGSWAALALSLIVLVASVAGYARLADLVMRALLASAYTGVALYVLTSAGQGMVHGMLYMPPFSFLAGIRRLRARVAARINRGMKWIAFLYWVALTLQASGFLQQAIGWIKSFWNVSADIGNLNIAVSDILIFILILWTTYVISRLSRFFLEEEIFSRVHLDRGLPYALSTTVHYIILVSGFVLAHTAIGVDTTKFTIVAGALTVGIGFGLQNIVNNFVSGLIVLFERPVKVGDTIEIDGVVGRVQHIGIRATVISSTAGSEVIIPNGKLISDKVTNWTLSSQLRQISVPVITKPDVSVIQLKAILKGVAQGNKQVLQTPSPEVLFIKRGVDAFEFELRVWTSDFDDWLKVKSDLTTDINEALGNKDIPAQAPPSVPPQDGVGPR
jgi:potassium efflux system protein